MSVLGGVKSTLKEFFMSRAGRIQESQRDALGKFEIASEAVSANPGDFRALLAAIQALKAAELNEGAIEDLSFKLSEYQTCSVLEADDLADILHIAMETRLPHVYHSQVYEAVFVYLGNRLTESVMTLITNKREEETSPHKSAETIRQYNKLLLSLSAFVDFLPEGSEEIRRVLMEEITAISGEHLEACRMASAMHPVTEDEGLRTAVQTKGFVDVPSAKKALLDMQSCILGKTADKKRVVQRVDDVFQHLRTAGVRWNFSFDHPPEDLDPTIAEKCREAMEIARSGMLVLDHFRAEQFDNTLDILLELERVSWAGGVSQIEGFVKLVDFFSAMYSTELVAKQTLMESVTLRALLERIMLVQIPAALGKIVDPSKRQWFKDQLVEEAADLVAMAKGMGIQHDAGCADEMHDADIVDSYGDYRDLHGTMVEAQADPSFETIGGVFNALLKIDPSSDFDPLQPLGDMTLAANIVFHLLPVYALTLYRFSQEEPAMVGLEEAMRVISELRPSIGDEVAAFVERGGDLPTLEVFMEQLSMAQANLSSRLEGVRPFAERGLAAAAGGAAAAPSAEGSLALSSLQMALEEIVHSL